MNRLFSFVEDFEKLKNKYWDRVPIPDFSLFDYSKSFLESLEKANLENLSLNQLDRDIEKLVEKYFANEDGLFGFKEIIRLKIIFEPMVNKFSKIFNPDKWHKEVCPLCSGKPGLAYIDGEGRRELQCSICNMRWRFRRAVCPFCLQESGNYTEFNMEDKNVRVEYCENCRGYIKTFLLGEGTSSYQLDLKSLNIDAWALKEGFIKHTTSMIGINFIS